MPSVLPNGAQAPWSGDCSSSVMYWHRAYAGSPDQARFVRRFVGLLLDGFPQADGVVFAAGELAANAIRHTRSGRPGGVFEVEVRRWRDGAAIAVTDQGGTGWPMPGYAGELSESGRGLAAVRVVADHLGWTGDEQGRTVFAVFASAGPPPIPHPVPPDLARTVPVLDPGRNEGSAPTASERG